MSKLPALSQSAQPVRPISLSAIVESYRDRIRRETGRTPDYPSALRDLDTAREAGDEIEAEAFPARRDLLPLRLFLAEREYCELAIESILRDVSRCGSVWCAGAIDDEDVEAAERLVPGVNAWQWDGSADNWFFGLADCDDLPGCRCEGCNDLRRVYEESLLLVDPSAEG
jgi:hypothetical protein